MLYTIYYIIRFLRRSATEALLGLAFEFGSEIELPFQFRFEHELGFELAFDSEFRFELPGCSWLLLAAPKRGGEDKT